MADTFGLKIGLEGEREFKDALRDINQSFKVLGSEMQLVSSKFDKNDKSVQALTSRNTVLNKEIDTQKDKISTLKSALDNASSSFGETDKRTQECHARKNKGGRVYRRVYQSRLILKLHKQMVDCHFHHLFAYIICIIKNL